MIKDIQWIPIITRGVIERNKNRLDLSYEQQFITRSINNKLPKGKKTDLKISSSTLSSRFPEERRLKEGKGHKTLGLFVIEIKE
jgi:hypothetical protein